MAGCRRGGRSSVVSTRRTRALFRDPDCACNAVWMFSDKQGKEEESWGADALARLLTASLLRTYRVPGVCSGKHAKQMSGGRPHKTCDRVAPAPLPSAKRLNRKTMQGRRSPGEAERKDQKQRRDTASNTGHVFDAASARIGAASTAAGRSNLFSRAATCTAFCRSSMHQARPCDAAATAGTCRS